MKSCSSSSKLCYANKKQLFVVLRRKFKIKKAVHPQFFVLSRMGHPLNRLPRLSIVHATSSRIGCGQLQCIMFATSWLLLYQRDQDKSLANLVLWPAIRRLRKVLGKCLGSLYQDDKKEKTSDKVLSDMIRSKKTQGDNELCEALERPYMSHYQKKIKRILDSIQCFVSSLYRNLVRVYEDVASGSEIRSVVLVGRKRGSSYIPNVGDFSVIDGHLGDWSLRRNLLWGNELGFGIVYAITYTSRLRCNLLTESKTWLFTP
ncbi:hypothetical protein Tco_1005059 [Tanacetum coccineum]|uniref:Uncharacterized protein n=1 Tax=Tanacetum coccineum TaxID=301880 RepID=A0ABQ5FE15_9ASTR